jgi:hypothetical protein
LIFWNHGIFGGKTKYSRKIAKHLGNLEHALFQKIEKSSGGVKFNHDKY